jgi:hypothetical protein
MLTKLSNFQSDGRYSGGTVRISWRDLKAPESMIRYGVRNTSATIVPTIVRPHRLRSFLRGAADVPVPAAVFGGSRTAPLVTN